MVDDTAAVAQWRIRPGNSQPLEPRLPSFSLAKKTINRNGRHCTQMGSLSRRDFLGGSGLLGAGAVAGWSLHQYPETARDHHGFSHTTPKTADESLARLVAGNKCYIVEHFDMGDVRRTNLRRQAVASAQHPYAVILSCAESRVSPDIVFTAGLGDLFVVRVAGNIVSRQCLGVTGSIEYAVEELKIPLVLVLGHEGCGAVKAAVESVRRGVRPANAIGAIVDAIRPAIEDVATQPGNLLDNVVVENVRQAVAALVQSDEIVAPMVAAGRLKVVGGVYELTSGRVRFLS
jgi:carbonic anhydrase